MARLIAYGKGFKSETDFQNKGIKILDTGQTTICIEGEDAKAAYLYLTDSEVKQIKAWALQQVINDL